MATRNTDVNLIIRARNEAGTAITSVAEALKGLVSAADTAGAGTGGLAERIAQLDKTYAGLAERTTAVREATSRQAQDLHSGNTAIQERRELIATLSAGLDKLKSQSDKAFVGPRDPALPQQIKLTQQRINEAERDLRKLTTAYEGNLNTVREGRSTLLELTTATAAVADAQEAAKSAIAKTTVAIREQAEAAAQAARVSPTQRGINDRAGITRTPKSAADSAGVFGNADQQLDAEAKALRAALDPLAAIQERFNTSLARYRVLAGAGKISTDELAAAEKHLAAEADRARKSVDGTKGGKVSLFGLKPYELQNLSYQINDVVTGIASGQHFTQILAQQGGQILQLFPKAGGAIIGALTNPGVLAGVAAIGILAVSIGRAADNADRLRATTANLKFRADGELYNAKSLSETQRQLQAVGASAADAQAAVRTFLDSSIAPDKIDQFSKAARATAEILGSDLPTAAKDVATAFTGGYDAIAAFDEKLNFLTGTQREHIRSLFDQGDAEKARTEALNIYSQKAQDTADKQRGPWSAATRDLKSSWDRLLESFANTKAIKDSIGLIDALAGSLRGLANIIDDISSGGDLSTLNADLAEIKAINAALANPKINRNSLYLRNEVTGQEYNDQQLRDRVKFLQQQYNNTARKNNRPSIGADGAEIKAPPAPKTPDTKTNGADTVEKKRVADKLSQLDIETRLEVLRREGSKGLSAAQAKERVTLAGQLAYMREIRSSGSAILADAEKRKAVSTEQVQVDQQQAAAAASARNKRKQDARDEESAIKRFNQRIVGAEGGNRKNAAGSNAAGYGQFTPDTYKRYFARVYPDSKLSAPQILETRYQKDIATGIIDAFTRDNAATLRSLGKAVNGANLYTLHLFGNTPLGKAALSNDNVPIDQLVNRDGGKYKGQILSQNAGYLRTEKGKGRYRTAGELRTLLGAKVGDISTEDTVGDAQRTAVLNLGDAAAQKQDNFNLSVKEGNDERDRQVAGLKAVNGLTGTALLDAQRKIAVDRAEFDLRRRVADANRNREPGAPEITVSDEQIKQTREATAALNDSETAAARLRAKLDDVSRPTDELREQIDLLRQQADFLRSIGENKAADTVEKQIDALNPKLNDAIEALIEFYKALTPEERVSLGIVDESQLDNVIAKLEAGRQATEQWGKVAGISSKDIAQAFASASAQSFTNFLQKVSQGRNVFKSLGESVLEFASNFASAIAQMIIQLLAYAAVVAILKALGVPVPGGNVFGGGGGGGGSLGVGLGGGAGSGDGAGVFHSGGIAGQLGGRSRVTSFDFSGATRYHGGGIAGLAPDEVGAVLRRGEEVLTEQDPRHRNNGGGAKSDAGGGVSVILVNDHAEALQRGLEQPKGQKVFIKHISDNAGSINAALGR